MQRLSQRWDKRSSGVKPLTVESSIDIACSTQDLWDFLVAPESAVLTGEGVVKAFRVPGAPAGVAGDQHCVVSEIDGRLTVHMAEVVEANAPNRMVILWPTISTTVLSTSTLTPTHAGTRYSNSKGYRWPVAPAERSSSRCRKPWQTATSGSRPASNPAPASPPLGIRRVVSCSAGSHGRLAE
jgi:hypothetical protein